MDKFNKALKLLFASSPNKDRMTQSQLRTPVPKKVSDKAISYTRRHRGQWFWPEYQFDEIQIAQDSDSYLFRAIKKTIDRLLTAGWEFVGENPDIVEYIKYRIQFIEIATDRPWKLQILETAQDLKRYSNCMWVKVRDRKRSPGRVRRSLTDKELDPVAGYFILPLETLRFKTKANGEIKKVIQRMPDGKEKQFSPDDIIHLYANKKPGFSVGTPEMFPALDDIALLRRIEENVEELIESSLFPVFHYRIGTDEFPERYGPSGEKESDIVREQIEYMPAGSIYISDHRHEIEALGSEGKALRIDFYLDYFKKRVFAAIGTTNVDMGEGTGATRSTASTMSKSMMMDVEALQETLKIFIDHFVIQELLQEGGYNPIDPEQRVQIQFGIVDKEDRRADENQEIQKLINNGITHAEFRRNLGLRPMTEEELQDTFFAQFEEPLTFIKGIAANVAGLDVLSNHPASRVTPEMVNREIAVTKELEKAARPPAASGSPSRSSSSSSRAGRQSASRSRPSNQHGTRSGPKTTRDIEFVIEDRIYEYNIDFDITDEKVEEWKNIVQKRYAKLANKGIGFDTLAQSMLWRLDPDKK